MLNDFKINENQRIEKENLIKKNIKQKIKYINSKKLMRIK